MSGARFPVGRATTAALVALAVLAAAGCDPFGGPLPGDPSPAPYFIQHFQGEGAFRLDVDVGDAARDVYLTFVNPDLSIASGSLTVAGSVSDREYDGSASARAMAHEVRTGVRRAPTPAAIVEYNQDPFGTRERSAPSLRLFERPPLPLFDAYLDERIFYDYLNQPVAATCRAVVGPVDVGAGGTRTLNVWVADDCWSESGGPTAVITEEMVTALGGKFLTVGAFDDIYDWVTGMLGAEWGPHPYADLIPESGEITIFLCDIADPPTGGTLVGYYYSRDNVLRTYEPASNERVMFTIDAPIYAMEEGGGDSFWDPTDPWPAEIFSTLAHEFQHMVHFYQRDVLRDAMAGSDTWINEMASQVVEDLLADKLDVIGPRGVDGSDGTAGAPGNTEGRLPLFNATNYISLSAWGGSGDLESYSITYAFGAWLARNYGGALLLHRLMECPLIGRASIEDIVSQDTGSVESFARILQRWSAAQLLSDTTDAPRGYRYNTGGFIESSVNGYAYRLGSIDLFAYTPAPYLSAGGFVGTSQHLSTSAALYDAATPGTGGLSWALDMPDGMIATVVVK